MGKRLVYICDGEGCGTVLLGEDDGFVLQGMIKQSSPDNGKTLLQSTPETNGELVYCKECFCRALDIV